MKSVKPIENWPKLYHDILKVKDSTNHVGICTLWTERGIVERIVDKLPYNVIGNLYSAQGINAMIRNVMANPNIRTIVIWGSEMSLSGHSLLMFMKFGIDEKRKIIKGRGEIEAEIPDSVIAEFREKIEVVDLRGRTKDQLIEKQIRGLPKVPRTITILLCTENLHISDDELKIYFKIKHRKIIYNPRKEFKNFNRNNKTDCKLFFETYDKLNIQLMDYIQKIKNT